MLNRIAAVAAVLTVALSGACTPRPKAPLAGTASVTVNSKEAKFQIVKCSQVQWYRTIDIGGDFSGAKVVVDERGAPAKAESVNIRNSNGFTGMYSQGDGGDASLSLNDDRYTITGTAHGYKVDKPGEPADATFKITVAC